MIMGILSLVIFIIGCALFLYGFSKGIEELIGLGLFISIIGICGIAFFISVNINTIKAWFTI